MQIENTYHEGELFVQRRVDQVEQARRNGRAISDSILKGALKYIEQQPLAVFGSVDGEENIWASVLVGKPGFMRAPDERTVEVDLTLTARNRQDPFWTNIEHNSQVGMLIIDLGTRRRLRINGRISRTAQDERLRLHVAESYPNCPKYIQRRHATAPTLEGASRSLEPLQAHSLKPDQQAFIRSVDTFFVASAHPERGVDASHRGGNPGFIRVLGDRSIRVPDYAGNSMFNTLGNFTVNAHAGLVFFDFKGTRMLQLTGRPEILWDVDDPTNETGGTGRYWDLEIDRCLETHVPQQHEWEFLDSSPHNPELATAGAEQIPAAGTKATKHVCPLCEGVESEQPGDCPKCGMTLCSP